MCTKMRQSHALQTGQKSPGTETWEFRIQPQPHSSSFLRHAQVRRDKYMYLTDQRIYAVATLPFSRQVCGTASEMLVCCAQGLDCGKSSEEEVSALSAYWDQLPPSRCGSAQSGFYLLLALIIYPVVTSKYPVGENNRQWRNRASVKDAAVSLDRSFTWPSCGPQDFS